MSSHHFVREGQEPAMIIANGESCSYELMTQLLEWNPFIVVLDGALKRVVELGIKFDVLLGDFDSRHPHVDPSLLPHPLHIVHTPDQEKTDLEKGIEFLVEEGHRAVNIIWATGRRSDHYMSNISMLGRYRDMIDLVMLDDYSKIFPLKNHFKKQYRKNDNVSLIPLNRVEGLTTQNLVWNLNGASIEYPFATSSSNRVASDGIVEITFSSGILLMMECTDIEP